MTHPGPLKPATPHTPEAAAYLPRFPFRGLALAVMLIATVVIGYRLRQRSRTTGLRQQILQVHGAVLAEPRTRYHTFRERLEQLVVDAAHSTPDGHSADGLKLGGLRSGQGLYLRLPRSAAQDRQQLAAAAVQMRPDNLLRCLGLTAASARGIFEQGQFLEDGWADEISQTKDMMRLRVADEMLAQHIEQELPSLLNQLRSEWLLLVLDHQSDQDTHMADVFLWDLAADKQLLSARLTPQGAYLRARIAQHSSPAASPEPGIEDTLRAQDCSIAAQLRAMQGARLTVIQSPATSSAP